MRILRTSGCLFAFALPLASLGCGADGPGASTANVTDAAVSTDAGAASDVFTQPAHGGDAGSDAHVDVSCAVLCDLVDASCKGALAPYATRAECMHECSDMQPGDFGDARDTLGCRQAHAAAAAQSPATECPAAGSFGAGKCGDRCNSFCTLAVERCGGAHTIYGDKTTCDFQCGSRYAFDANQPELTDAGNTLNCRMGYLKQALDSQAADAGAPVDCSLAGGDSTACR
jgi:hypothetical protein